MPTRDDVVTFTVFHSGPGYRFRVNVGSTTRVCPEGIVFATIGAAASAAAWFAEDTLHTSDTQPALPAIVLP